MKLRDSVAAIALVALSGPALGADVYGGSQSPAQVTLDKPALWSGLYVGVHAGYGWGEWSGTPEYDPGTGPFTGLFDKGEAEAEGYLAGVTVGANKQLGQIVLGIEADASWGNLKGEGSFDSKNLTSTPYDDRGYNWGVENELKNLATVRGRLGYAMGPVLVYGTGGIAFGQTEASETVTCSSPNCLTPTVTARASAEENHIGWVAGAGAEALIAPNFTVKAEWLHVDLGEADYRFKGTAYPGTLNLPHTTDSYPSALEFDVFRIGASYKFD